MAQDKAALAALISSNLPDNTAGQITPQKHREVSTQVMDSALNTAEAGPQSVAGLVDFTGGLQSGGRGVAVGAVYSPKAASASLVDQDPSGVDAPIIISFGAGQTTPDITISAAGRITANTGGDYLISMLASPGRSSGAGTAVLAARALLNGNPYGRTVVYRMTDTDSSSGSLFLIPILLTAGDYMEFQLKRDGSGTNNGGLVSTAISGGWDASPSAAVTVFKLEAVT